MGLLEVAFHMNGSHASVANDHTDHSGCMPLVVHPYDVIKLVGNRSIYCSGIRNRHAYQFDQAIDAANVGQIKQAIVGGSHCTYGFPEEHMTLNHVDEHSCFHLNQLAQPIQKPLGIILIVDEWS